MPDSDATRTWDSDRTKLASSSAGPGAEKKHAALFIAHAATQGEGYMNRLRKA